MSDSGMVPSSPTSTVKSSTRRIMIRGFALTVPLLVTVLVVGMVVNTLSNVLDPVVLLILDLFGRDPSRTPTGLLKLVALGVFLAGIFCFGVIAEQRSGPGRIEAFFESTIQALPAIGSLYTSFDQLSDMMLDSDTQSFQEVVLVEYPTPGSYTIAFVTANTPEKICSATGNSEMVTLFMPMAPNPVMGGYVIHVSNERVYDVDMTVEDGIQCIVTSGVAVAEGTVETPVGAESASPSPPHHPDEDARKRGASEPDTDSEKRRAAYLDEMDPEHAETPDAVSRQGRDESALDDETDTACDRRQDEQD